MKDNLKCLNKILLSKEVRYNFYKHLQQSDFKSWLINLIPEILMCKNQEQNTDWHLYNVLDHILYSIENINKLSVDYNENERLLLSYAMLFHDLGKPQMHIIKTFNGVEYDSFTGHAQQSVEIFKNVCAELKISNENQIKIIWLIANHDIFSDFLILFKTNQIDLLKENYKKIIESLPAEAENKLFLLKALVLVAKADNFAQNPQLTKSTLQIIEDFSNFIKNL